MTPAGTTTSVSASASAAAAPTTVTTTSAAPASTIPFPSTVLSASSAGDTWKVRNDKALGIIIEYISNEKLDIIADETTAKEAWDKLEKVHQGTNVALQAFFILTDMLER
ncbi:hypothetical protein F5I97DRAFT_2076493, partial [Phlebopus sp. FC_14]